MFIVLEGIDGSGKTTAREFIADWFRKQGREVVVTREPGGTPMAEKIRSLILSDPSSSEDALTPMAKTLLFMAAREQHIKNVILPALEKGKVVISDRFCDSTFAYQSYEGILMDKLLDLHKLAFDDFKPNLTFVMDGDPEVFRSRLEDRGETNYYDRMPPEFHNYTRCLYLSMTVREGHRYVVINAEDSLAEVKNQITKELGAFNHKHYNGV